MVLFNQDHKQAKLMIIFMVDFLGLEDQHIDNYSRVIKLKINLLDKVLVLQVDFQRIFKIQIIFINIVSYFLNLETTYRNEYLLDRGKRCKRGNEISTNPLL